MAPTGRSDEGKTMTTQLDAPMLGFGRLEEFAGKVAADQAAAYNAILVYLGDRLGLWQALAPLGITDCFDDVRRRQDAVVDQHRRARAADGREPPPARDHAGRPG